MAEQDADVQLALQLTLLARDWHCLPRAGGVLDQDAYLMMLMTTCNSVINEVENERAKKGVK